MKDDTQLAVAGIINQVERELLEHSDYAQAYSSLKEHLDNLFSEERKSLESIKSKLSCLKPGGERITSDQCIDGHRIIQTEKNIYVTTQTVESYGFPFDKADDDA